MRWTRRILLALSVVVGLIGVAVVVLLTIDLGRFKGTLEEFVRDTTGREFAIAGDFQMSVGARIDLVAGDVRLANADWGTAENILELERVAVSIDTWSLFAGPVDVLELEIEGLTLHVEEDPETLRSSWSFGEAADDASEDVGRFELPLWLRQANLERVSVTYGQGWLDRPHTISVASARVSEQEGELLELDLAGAIDNEPIRAEGHVGPLRALLDGRDPRWDLQVAIGEFLATTEGTFADLFSLEGPRVQALMQGPLAENVLARLGLPPLARGPVDITVNLTEGPQGIELRIEGAFGDLTTNIIGSTTSFSTIGQGDLAVDVRGPNLRAVGKLFGAGFLPEHAFVVEGDLTHAGDTVTLQSLVVAAGETRVELNGTLASPEVDPDARLQLFAKGPEIRDFLPPALADGIPAGAFDMRAAAAGGLARPELRQLVLELGEDTLAVGLSDMSIPLASLAGAPATLDGLHAAIAVSGADLEDVLEPWVDVVVAAVPFSIEGNLDGSGDALQLSGVTFQAGPVRGTLAGTTGSLPSLDGLSLQTSLAGPDASQYLEVFATQETDIRLPPIPFETNASLSKSGTGWSVNSWVLQIGESRFEMSGNLGDVDSETGIDIDFAASGPDLRPFLADRGIDSPEPFSIEGGMAISQTTIELQEVSLRIGETTAWLDGTLPTAMEIVDAQFDLRIAGPNLQRIGRALDIKGLPADAYRFEGGIRRSGQHYVVKELNAVIGDNDLTGDIRLEMGAKPRVTAELNSQRLNLTELLADEDDEAAEDTPPSGRVIPDTPLPLNLLDVVDLDVTLRLQQFDSGLFQLGTVDLRAVAANDELHIDTKRVSLTHGGTLTASLDLVRTADDRADLQITTVARQYQFRPPVDRDGEPINRPPKDLDLELSGSGGTLRELAASANGGVGMRVGAGELNNELRGFLFRDFLRQLLPAINPVAEETKRTRLNCGFLEVDVVDGVARTRALGFQTDQLAIASIGTIDLATEVLDFSFRIKQREGVGVSLAGVINPYVKVGGTLASPALEIDTRRGIVSGTLAVLTGGLSILAKGAWDRYLSRDDYCEAVIEALDAGEIPDWQDTSGGP